MPNDRRLPVMQLMDVARIEACPRACATLGVRLSIYRFRSPTLRVVYLGNKYASAENEGKDVPKVT